MPGEVIVILGIIGLAVICRLMAGSFDGARIGRYVSEMGCQLIRKRWAPLGPGWFGEKNSRIYQIVYRDSVGRTHRAHAKTSMLCGVYLTNDRIIKDAPRLSVEEEKAALRKRLAQLERITPS